MSITDERASFSSIKAPSTASSRSVACGGNLPKPAKALGWLPGYGVRFVYFGYRYQLSWENKNILKKRGCTNSLNLFILTG
jgi:hypothetical protein